MQRLYQEKSIIQQYNEFMEEAMKSSQINNPSNGADMEVAKFGDNDGYGGEEDGEEGNVDDVDSDDLANNDVQQYKSMKWNLPPPMIAP